MSLLETIKNPSDLKKLNIKELEQLAQEIRKMIVDVTEKNGGHLASSLGAVDSIIALYYVFDFPKDKLIFDVGHQAYAHKILSERSELFETIRMGGGLSGFPNIFESPYDAFTVGHAGTSIAASIGYACARDKLKEDYYVICFVGDGSMFNGENLESLISLDDKPEKLLIILNDNGMSISKTSNSLYKMMSRVSMKKKYSNFMYSMEKIFGWNFIGNFLKKVKTVFKRATSTFSILDEADIKYVGAFDGNNISLMIKLLTNFKNSPRTTLLHIKTKKGKGYEPAEISAEKYHGIGKHMLSSESSFSNNVGKSLVKLAETEQKLVTITAGMTYGTGLTDFSNIYPDRFYDVGICEEYAVTFAAGLALAGMKPVVCIYSTFLQRSYDQIMLDVCLQNLPVIFMLDRAGFVGVDGATHQGLYDISYLRHIPNITILSPKDSKELDEALLYALSLNTPVAIRYPNGLNDDFSEHNSCISNESLWETIEDGKLGCILAVGPRMNRIANKLKGNNIAIINARSVKPLDSEVLNKYKKYKIVTLEENTKVGGFGSAVLEYYSSIGVSANVTIFGAEDSFVLHDSVKNQMTSNNITVENIKKVFKIK